MITVVLVAAALAACSPPEVWHRSGGSQQDLSADTTACQNAAQRLGDSEGVLIGHLESYNFFNQCMADRGYLVSLY